MTVITHIDALRLKLPLLSSAFLFFPFLSFPPLGDLVGGSGGRAASGGSGGTSSSVLITSSSSMSSGSGTSKGAGGISITTVGSSSVSSSGGESSATSGGSAAGFVASEGSSMFSILASGAGEGRREGGLGGVSVSTVTKTSYSSGGSADAKRGGSSTAAYSPVPLERKSMTTVTTAHSEVFDG